MKNLKLLSSHHTYASKDADCFCIDLDSNNVYFGTDNAIYCLDKLSNKVSKCTELNAEIKSSEICYTIGMEYLIETQTIFLALSSGDIFVYDLYRKETECVGSVESGLKGLSWSPDQEFLVLLTGENTLILMTKDFDPISEKNLCTDEFGESKPITVGWGSKETQFHGSEGKGAAKITKIEPKPALSTDDQRSRISWRGDGEYFVTSTIDPNEGYRKLRIWSREAILQCTAEVKDGLEQAICWRPSGNLITCTQQFANKHKVIFFERNGLQHGEFVLPFKPNTCKVTGLLWNSDSTVLVVLAEEITESSRAIAQIMLWTCGNYHWYLKQRLYFDGSHINSFFVQWDQGHPYKLHIYRKEGDYFEYTWAWCVSHSLGNDENDDAIVSSIDNSDVLITPFRKMVVPPPLCAYSISAPCSIDTVCFTPGSCREFALYLSDHRLAIFQEDPLPENTTAPRDCELNLVAAGGNGFKSQIKPYNFERIYCIKLKADFTPMTFCHWTWVRDRKLLCICYPYMNSEACTTLLSVQVPQAFSTENTDLEARCIKSLEKPVIGMCSNTDGSLVALQLYDGNVLKYNHEEISPWLCDNNRNLVFPQPCSQISIFPVQGRDYVLGLTDRFSLFCNDTLILPTCTSYSIHNEFLLATTIDHTLKCFLKDYDVPAILRSKTLASAEISSQKIERGAKIVITTSGDTKVVLQMPRGNLEVIHPRPLVLSSVCKHLDQLQFGKAFEISKVQRIDLNLLYDHNPKLFLDSIEMIIDQIGSATNLNLLLASLKQEDVSETMYSFAYKGKQKPESLALNNKIDTVCNSFRNALEAKHDDRYFQTLIATYAKKSEPELDKALIKIKNVKDCPSRSPKAAQTVVDESLKFLIYLVDVSDLFNVAIGTYDFEIAIMVAQKSQKDPKEFLPFFNDLQKLEENYRKYKIDMHLQKYKQALQNISKCEEHFEECITLIKEQRLYADALYLFPPSSDQYKIVWKEYGNYLMEKRYLDEAGLAFTKCGDHEKALLAYKECSNWQMVLCSAENLNYTDEKIISLCQEMSEKLKENKKFLDASFLLEHYVKDVEESIVMLIDGCEWNSALLLMSKYRRYDIAETHLKPALNEHWMYLNSYVEQLKTDFCTHTERLKILRSEKKQVTEMPDLVKMTDDELFSETSSVSDLTSSCAESKQLSGSIMTRKSSKSRRKQKLKKYRLKEGSPNEHLARIAELSEIVVKVDNLKDNFLNTLKALVRFGFDENARCLQQKMTNIIGTIEDEILNIWSPAQSSTAPEITYGPDATANSIAAAAQMQKDITIQTDPELAPPVWRKNVEVTLQIFR